MPKVMVLFFGGDENAPMVDAVVAGAKSVRFTEVEVRTSVEGDAASNRKRIDPAHPIGEADGAVIVGSGTGAAFAHVADQLAHGPAVQNLVIGVAGDASAVDRIARTGAIVIAGQSTGTDSQSIEIARALGARVAKVAGWVRHGLGHEAEQHGHEHHHHGHQSHEHHHHEHH